MTRAPRLAAGVVGLMLGASTAAAHHGWSGYDSSKELTFTGTIKESGYAPPSRMEHRGLGRAMLAPGTRATVVGYPHRTDPDEMRAERITIAGKTTELR